MELSSSNECYGCGRSGHWVKNCPGASGSRVRSARGRGRGKGTTYFKYHTQYLIIVKIKWMCFILMYTSDCIFTELFCYRCGDQGHMARDCDQTEDGMHRLPCLF